MNRIVFHLDMDAFFVSVEQLDGYSDQEAAVSAFGTTILRHEPIQPKRSHLVSSLAERPDVGVASRGETGFRANHAS